MRPYILILSLFIVLSSPCNATAQVEFPSTEAFVKSILEGRRIYALKPEVISTEMDYPTGQEWSDARGTDPSVEPISSTCCCDNVEAVIALQKRQLRLTFQVQDVAGLTI